MIYDSSCGACDLCLEAMTVCLPGQGDPHADIMVVGDSPAYKDDAFGKPFESAGARYVISKLEAAGLNTGRMFFTYAVKCRPSSGKPGTTEIKACAKFLQAEIEAVRPRFILAIGDAALRALTGKTGITTKHGEKFPLKLATTVPDVVVFPVYNPAYVLKRPNEEQVFIQDIAYFAGLTKGHHSLPKDFDYKVVLDDETLVELHEKVKTAKFVVYDIENSDQRTAEDLKVFDKDKPAKPHQGRLMLLSLGFDDGSIYVIPWEHKRGPDTAGWWRRVHSVAVEALETGKPACAHNGKYDNKWLNSRMVYPKQTFDTMLGVYLLDENQPKSLKFQAKARYGAPDWDVGIEYSEEFDFDKLCLYAAIDIYYTRMLYLDVRRELAADQGLARVFKYVLMPASNALGRVENRGMYVDEQKLSEAELFLTSEEARLKDELERLSPIKGVNWNSPAQKAKVLFSSEGLNLDPVKKSESGAPSTDKETLAHLAAEHPLVETLRQYNVIRDRLKFVTAWKPLVENAKKHFGEPRLYPTYNVAKARTGRLSCEDPNLQQVPRDKIVKGIIAAAPGKVIMEADGSQMELRGVAIESKDPTMTEAIRAGRDLHIVTGATIAGVREEEVTKEQRQGAKAANFGLVYGQQAKGFQGYAFVNYGVRWTLEEATEVRNKWFGLYRGIKPWHNRCERFIREHGYIKTLLGRYRRLPNIFSPERSVQNEAVRQGINFTVQSLSSDIVQMALVYLENLNDPRFEVIGTVHDSIVLEVEEAHAEDVAELVSEVIEHIVPEVLIPRLFKVRLAVPILSEIKYGTHWGSGKVWEPKRKENQHVS